MKVVAVYDFLPKRKQKRVSHASNQKDHFKGRFFERVGVTLTDSAYEKLKAGVRERGVYLGPSRTDERNSVYSFDYERMRMRIVYNLKNDELVTIL